MTSLVADYGSDSESEADKQAASATNKQRLVDTLSAAEEAPRKVKIKLDLLEHDHQGPDSSHPTKKSRFSLENAPQKGVTAFLPPPKNRALIVKAPAVVRIAQKQTRANLSDDVDDFPSSATSRVGSTTHSLPVPEEKSERGIDGETSRLPLLSEKDDIDQRKSFFTFEHASEKNSRSLSKSFSAAPVVDNSKTSEEDTTLTMEQYEHYLLSGYFYNGNTWEHNPSAAQKAVQTLYLPPPPQKDLMPEISAEEMMQSAQGRTLPKAMIFEEEKPLEDETERLKRAAPLGDARKKNQITSLLSDARTNRAQLEEMIARNKASARAARAKYGF